MNNVLRMIDANANRAREGLRLMEDFARFALDDAALSSRCKDARHAITQIVRSIAPDRLQLLASRDTPGDVGTEIKVAGELARSDMRASLAAAAGRTTEALRVISECAKSMESAEAREAGQRAERVRYEVYELEKRLVMATGTGLVCQWRLCVLITESLCAKLSWREVAAQALRAGADCLQLREKSLSDGELLARAKELVDMARPRGASVIVNDRVDIALASGAHGVHLGQGDMPIEHARAIAGDRLVIGLSTHDLSEARAALAQGADYAGVGAMFATSTKVRETSGVAYLREFLELVKDKRPMGHLAIGGITPTNVGELAQAGCAGVAVSSCVCASSEPGKVCAEILRKLVGHAK